MKDLVMPTFSGEAYDPIECVAIRDRYQSYLYIKHGVYPKDIYVSNDDLVMVFDKKESYPLYLKWRSHELN